MHIIEKITRNDNIIKDRFFLILTITTIVSFICSASENSRFNTTFFDPSDSGAEESLAASKDSTSESKSKDCPTISRGCNNVPNVNKFRTIDGTCNNLRRKYCGAAGIPYVRYIPRSPSGSAFRCPLSSCARPRDVSYALNNDCFSDHCDGVTLMVMQWGQLIDHDLVFTPGETAQLTNDFQICKKNFYISWVFLL
ncbi:hypothetical protein Avbf_18289 [Armadillidium vulgare]|nr:hypothetical protein Avbf_18289 [Armadillidium vulgare]